MYYGTTIGITRFQWGLMAAISSWLIMAQIYSAAVTEQTGRRKVLWFWLALGDRAMRPAGIVTSLALWTSGSPAAPLAMIVAVCLANFFGTMGNPAWLSWLADIIPQEEHGTFWGRRSAWIAPATIAAVVPAGRLKTALVVLGIASIVGGTGSSAATNAATKLITRFPSPENRAGYIAVSATLGSLAGGFGVLPPGALLQILKTHASADFLDWSGGGFRVLFLASLILRLGSAVLLIPQTPDLAGGDQR